jgi:hypothetical protein
MYTKIFKIILGISLILNVVLALCLFQSYFKVSKNITPSTISTQNTNKPFLSSYPKIEDTWITPVSLSYDRACLIKASHCSDLGQAQIGGDGVRARIFPKSDDREKVEIRFYTGEEEWVAIPRFTTASFLEVNEDWFSLKIWLNNSSVYIATSGGHEGYPEYFVSYLGATHPTWEKFEPWNYVKGKFPDIIQPPFSLEVGSQYIRLTEEDYCCDTVHSNTPERNANRWVYVLQQVYDSNEQPIYTVVDQGTIPR